MLIKPIRTRTLLTEAEHRLLVLVVRELPQYQDYARFVAKWGAPTPPPARKTASGLLRHGSEAALTPVFLLCRLALGMGQRGFTRLSTMRRISASIRPSACSSSGSSPARARSLNTS